MLFDDMYIHEVSVLEQRSVSDGGGGSRLKWVETGVTIPCLLDTPRTERVFQFQQVQKTLDRDMFYDPSHDFPATARFKCGSDVYRQEGKPEDQGGQGEVMRLPLALI